MYKAAASQPMLIVECVLVAASFVVSQSKHGYDAKLSCAFCFKSKA